MDNKTILICNAALYVGTFILYQAKVKKFTLGSFVLLFYAILASLAIDLFYNTDLIIGYSNRTLTVFPFVYLYITLMMMFFPLLKFSSRNNCTIILTHNTLIKRFSIIAVFICCFYFFFIRLPSIDFSMLFNPEQYALNYLDNRLDEGKKIEFGFVNFMSLLYYAIFEPLIPLLWIYNIIIDNKKLSKCLLFCWFLIIISNSATGHRDSLVKSLLSLVYVYFIFRFYISKKIKKRLITTAFCIGAVMFLFFMISTIGRFSNKDASTSIYIEDYAAQSFLNFNTYGLDAGGTRQGDKIVPLVKVLLGEPISKNYLDRRTMYSNLKIDDSVFYTFVGDFTIDFGPFFAFVFLLLISSFFTKMCVKNCYHFGNILWLFVLCRITIGGFTLYPYPDIAGNITLIFYCFVSFFFNFRYK